jgi:hypothetical protein
MFAAFAQWRKVRRLAFTVMRGMASALAMSFAIAAAALPRMSLLPAFALGTTCGLIAEGATQHVIRRPPKIEDVAKEEAAASSFHRG